MLTLRLVQGASPEAEWHLGPAAMGARRIVGTDAAAEWRVEAAGVAPGHIELYWDGQQLWVCDISKQGDVTLSGHPVADWVAAPAGSRIQFAGAVIDVTAGAQAGAGAFAPLPGFGAGGAAPVGGEFPATQAEQPAFVPTPSPTQSADGTTEHLRGVPFQDRLRTDKELQKRVGLFGGAGILVIVFLIILIVKKSGSDAPAMDPGAAATASPAAETMPPGTSLFGSLEEAPMDPAAEAAKGPDGGAPSAATKKEPESDLKSPEGRAVSRLIAGHLREALKEYEALGAAHPDRPEFPVVVSILRDRLKKRCVNGVGPGGEPCTPE